MADMLSKMIGRENPVICCLSSAHPHPHLLNTHILGASLWKNGWNKYSSEGGLVLEMPLEWTEEKAIEQRMLVRFFVWDSLSMTLFMLFSWLLASVQIVLSSWIWHKGSCWWRKAFYFLLIKLFSEWYINDKLLCLSEKEMQSCKCIKKQSWTHLLFILFYFFLLNLCSRSVSYACEDLFVSPFCLYIYSEQSMN